MSILDVIIQVTAVTFAGFIYGYKEINPQSKLHVHLWVQFVI